MFSLRSRNGRGVVRGWLVCGALTLGLVGCEDQSTSTGEERAGTSEHDGVEIVVQDRDDVNRRVDALVTADGSQWAVALSPLDDGPFAAGMSATITGVESNEWYELSIAVDESTGEVWYRERTLDYTLTGSRRAEAGRVFERYDVDGHEVAVDYPELSTEQMSRVVARYRSGDLASSDSPVIAELSTTLDTLEEFRLQHLTQESAGNLAGAVLVRVVNDPELAYVLIGDTQPEHKTTAGRVCWFATNCTTWMCRLGGLLNPLCTACGGTLAACVIAEISCWVARCDCCF